MPKIIYTNGCLAKLSQVIEGNVAALGGVGVGIAFIQVNYRDFVSHLDSLRVT